MYKWLPILCCCHCLPERSFFWKGKQFPVCARCTGVLVGILIGFVVSFFWRPPLLVCGLLLLPMIVDGFLQMLTPYNSNNILRFITGLLFSFGVMAFMGHTTVYAFSLGQEIGRSWRTS